MTPGKLLRELLYPFTETAVLFSMLAIFAVAKIASLVVGAFLASVFPVGVMLGLLAGVAILPVTTRYLMELLNARLEGVAARPLAIGMLGRFGLLWSLAPLGAVGGSIWAVIWVESALGASVAVGVAILCFTLMPAFLAALAITGSLLASLSPISMMQVVRQTGWPYLLVPAITLLGCLTLRLAANVGTPGFLVEFGALYLNVLGFSLTGAVVGASGIRDRVGEPAPEAPPIEKMQAEDLRARQAVADHAYALISRGNRDGGFAHIYAFIDNLQYLGTKGDMFEWFFQQMLRWEDKTPALFFARDYLGLLVQAGDSARALKVLSRCLYEDPRFRPRPEDRPYLCDMARKADNEDLVHQLR